MKSLAVMVSMWMVVAVAHAAPHRAAAPEAPALPSKTVVAQADLPQPVVAQAAQVAQVAAPAALLAATPANEASSSDTSPSMPGVLLAGLAAMLLVATRRSPR